MTEDPELEHYIREAEYERKLGGRLERIPRASSVKHECQKPSSYRVRLSLGDEWHCDCDKVWVWTAVGGPTPIHVWREAHYPMAITLTTILTSIAGLLIMVTFSVIDNWIARGVMVVIAFILVRLAFHIRTNLKK